MRVLIATDGSPASRIVQEDVITRLWPLGTEVLLLRCIAPAMYPVPPSLLELALKNAREELAKSAEGLSEHAGLRVSTLVTDGHPAKSIVEEAQAWSADFIFMGASGHGPVGRFLLGSTVTSVLHEAPCAVTVVRFPRNGHPLPATGARRILLATDGSSCSEKAVESLAARPWPAGTVVRIIGVPVFAGPRMETSYLDADAWAEVSAEATNEANRAVDAALLRLRAAGFTADGVVPHGLKGAKVCILDEAESWKADLIVVGSHGHGRLDRILLGSVSHALALYAPCSVEVFREKRVHSVKNNHRTEAGYIPVVPTATGGA